MLCPYGYFDAIIPDERFFVIHSIVGHDSPSAPTVISTQMEWLALWGIQTAVGFLFTPVMPGIIEYLSGIDGEENKFSNLFLVAG